MQLKKQVDFNVPAELVEAIESFPVERQVTHCGQQFSVSPFDFYATCPSCGTQIKVRSFSAVTEIEDIFDAVFTWMNHPGAQELARSRQQSIRDDE